MARPVGSHDQKVMSHLSATAKHINLRIAVMPLMMLAAYDTDTSGNGIKLLQNHVVLHFNCFNTMVPLMTVSASHVSRAGASGAYNQYSCVNNTKGQNKPCMILPCVRGLSESMKNICNKHGVQLHYRGGNTIEGLLMAPQVKDHITMKSGIIYRFKWDRVDCDDEYIGESSRTFGKYHLPYIWDEVLINIPELKLK